MTLAHSPAPPARTTLRINGLIAILAGGTLIFAASPIARSTGVGRPGLVALAGVWLGIYGADAFGAAVARRLRRVNVLPFAVLDAACAAGIVALMVAGSDAITFLGYALFASASATLAWFSYAGFRAAREL